MEEINHSNPNQDNVDSLGLQKDFELGMPGYEIVTFEDEEDDQVTVCGKSKYGSFMLCFTEGFEPVEREFEPGTLNITDFSVSEDLQGKGVGYAVRTCLATYGKSKGFGVIRSGIEAPIVNIAERMYREGVLLSPPIYLKEDYYLHPQDSSATILTRNQAKIGSGEIIGAEEAKELLNYREKLREEGKDFDFTVTCVCEL